MPAVKSSPARLCPGGPRRRHRLAGFLFAATAAACVVLSPLVSSAQESTPSGNPELTAPPAAAPPVTPPRGDVWRGAPANARYRVRQMESVLERAVQHAADMMRRRLQTMPPDVLALAGAPRAQGFRIEGYGLFFSVEVPRLSESVNWALRILSQDSDARVLASLQKVAASEQDPAVRADLERAIRTVQLQLSVASPLAARPSPRRQALPPAPVIAERSEPATVVAADRAAAPGPPQPASIAPQAVSPPGPATGASAPLTPQAEVFQDPSEAYEHEVKQALMDAVLDYAGSLDLPEREFVTVAARDAGYMAFPDTASDMVTVTLSVRAADLKAFRALRISREEARTRVVVREF